MLAISPLAHRLVIERFSLHMVLDIAPSDSTCTSENGFSWEPWYFICFCKVHCYQLSLMVVKLTL